MNSSHWRLCAQRTSAVLSVLTERCGSQECVLRVAGTGALLFSTDTGSLLNLPTRLSAFRAVLTELGEGQIPGHGHGPITPQVGGKV